MKRHHERPVSRVNPPARGVWRARYTGPDGRRRFVGTFEKKADAQRAIDEAYARPSPSRSFGDYAARWTERHPRADRTNRTNDHRLSRVLDVAIDGRALRDWPLRELKRRHVLTLVDAMLREQGRAPSGAANILRALSALFEDAITDEDADTNPVRGVRIRRNDERALKKARPVRVFSFEQMHAFAAHAGRWQPMVRMFCDCGLRLGEVLALYRSDLRDGLVEIRRTCDEGRIHLGTKTDHGEAGAGRAVPIPPTLARMLADMPTRIDAPLLFPTPTGRLWRQRNFYRDVWYPAQERSGLDIRPHEMRHSWVSHLRAAGVNDADLA